MRGLRGCAGIVAAVLALGSAAPAGAQTDKTGTPLTGRWGGPRIRLDATPSGAKLQVDCHVATLDAPVTPDASGSFVLSVPFVPIRGVEIEGAEASPKSTVKGTVDGDGLRLTIEAGASEVVGTFALTRNGAAKLPNCRMRG